MAQSHGAVAFFPLADGHQNGDVGFGVVHDLAREPLRPGVGEGAVAFGFQGGGNALGIHRLGGADGGHDDLIRGQPERELTPVVLQQDADKALQAAEDGVMDHHRHDLAVLGVDVVGVEALGLDPSYVTDNTFYRARGCRACEGQGYHGRIAIFEYMELDEALRELVFKGEGASRMRQAATSSGVLHALLADGARKVLAGKTSTREVLRVTRLSTET